MTDARFVWQLRRCAWLLDEDIPCGATRIKDIGIASEDAVAEVILAQELPDVPSLANDRPGSAENRTAGGLTFFGTRSFSPVGAALGQGHIKPRLDHTGQIHPAPAQDAIHGTVWPFANQLRYCRLPMWSEPWFRSSGHAVAEPDDGFGPRPPCAFWPGSTHCKKPPLQGLAHGRVNDVSKCVKAASLNPSVPVVK
jgi:hypothetical protein